MNPIYDNSVPFYPTIPNQNPINTFFPHHNGQYSRDPYAPHYQNAVYPHPAPPTIPYPPSFGYNSNRSVFFPAPGPRPCLYNPNLYSGIVNTPVAPVYPSNNHNFVNPGYYSNSSSGMSCGCANPNHNPGLTNANHGPANPRLIHVGNMVYHAANPNSSSQFNHSTNANQWPPSQNNTYYQPANQVSGNSSNSSWNYCPNVNQNLPPPSSCQNPNYPPSYNHNAGQPAATGNNRRWIPYSDQNTFRPIPIDHIDALSDFSVDPLSSPSEPNRADSTPDLAASNRQFTLPNDPRRSNLVRFLSLSSSPSETTLEICRKNHTAVPDHNAEITVITNREDREAKATKIGSQLNQPTCFDSHEEPIPPIAALNPTSSMDCTCANEDLVNFDSHGANSNEVRTDSTNIPGQSSNDVDSTPDSTANTAPVQIGTETVVESNDPVPNTPENGTETVVESNELSLNQAPSADIPNIVVGKASEKDQSLNDSLAEQNSRDLENDIASSAGEDQSAMPSGTLVVDNSTTSSTSGNPANSGSSPVNTTPILKQTTAFPDHTTHDVNVCPCNVNTEALQDVSNASDSPNSETQHQTLDSNTARRKYEKFLLGYAPDKVDLPTQISINFRYLLIRYLDRLDNVPITSDPHTTYSAIDNDLINRFVANLNAENRRVLQQNLKNIAPESVTHNLIDENQTVNSSEKNDADQNADIGREPAQDNVGLDSCADRDQRSVDVENVTEPHPQLIEDQTDDDVDVVNSNLDTIEVTVPATDNNSVEEEHLEAVPLDLAKEKNVSETEVAAGTRYFEFSHFLPNGNMYLQYFETPSGEKNTTVYAAYDQGNGDDAVDVLVEVPLNLTCKSRPAEAQREDTASQAPDVPAHTMQTPVDPETKRETKKQKKELKYDNVIKQAMSKCFKTKPDIAEPPKKKIRTNRGDNKLLRSLLKTDKPNI